MSNYLDKLDSGLWRIYTDYLEAQQTAKDSVSGGETQPEMPTRYNLALRYKDDLSEIEDLGFETTWNEIPSFAYGFVHLKDIERIASHTNVLSLEYGNEDELFLDESVPDIKARADTPGNIGANGLWYVNPSGGAMAATSQATGEGVIVGIIDTGIDITNPVFMKSLTPTKNTRILRIWDQGLDPINDIDPRKAELGPDAALLIAPVTYGVEYRYTNTNGNATINDYLNGTGPRPLRHKDCVGHGTHVASIAAGNGNPGPAPTFLGIPRAPFSFVGVAPKADIVVVKLLDVKSGIKDTNGNPLTTSRVLDAIKYIIEVAKTDGKSAVINMSFGGFTGPHDGLTDADGHIDAWFEAGGTYDEKYILVAAAGNSGGKRQHAKITIPAAGEIIVPFQLYDRGDAARKKYKECVHQDVTRDLYIDMWYTEVTTGDVSISAKVPTDAAFSAEVWSGDLTKRFDGGKRRTIRHRAPAAANRPDPPNLPTPVQRNNMWLEVQPFRGANPPQHSAGIYELKIKGPQGTVIHAWTSQARGHGFIVGLLTRLNDDEGSASVDLDVTDISHFNVGDRISITQNDGSEHETTIDTITAGVPGPLGVPGVFRVADGLPLDAKSGNKVIKVLDPNIDVDDKFLIGYYGSAKNIITVAAYDDKNGDTGHADYANIAGFSSRGPLADYSGIGPYAEKPDITAPGVAINAALSYEKKEPAQPLNQWIRDTFGNAFTSLRGTSMSSPHIAGVVALLLQKEPDLTVDDVKTIFHDPSKTEPGTRPTPADVNDYEDAYGGGMVNAKKAYDSVP